MNSWNRSTSYANDVKVPNLDIPSELQDLAYDVASGEVEAPDWDIFFARTVSDFYQRTGYHIGFNGRSSGYLVLYEAEANEDGTYSLYPGRSIDMYDGAAGWSWSRILTRPATGCGRALSSCWSTMPPASTRKSRGYPTALWSQRARACWPDGRRKTFATYPTDYRPQLRAV